jgi:hypothetical protein
MLCRENIPLAVMSAFSAAILLFVAFSESAMRPAPWQHDGCGWSTDTVIAPAWHLAESIRKDLWNPAFPPLPPGRPLDRVGCMKSNIMDIG